MLRSMSLKTKTAVLALGLAGIVQPTPSTSAHSTGLEYPPGVARAKTPPAIQSHGSTMPIGDRLVDIGGRSLFLRCQGSGSPTVVLDDAGFVEAWMNVQPSLAHVTRVCTSDRAGLGLSDPGPTPISSGLLARDLHALLQSARLPGPYLLVGHAFGGDTVRLYASLYPQEMAGLVLVDALPPALLTPALIPNGDEVDIVASRGALRGAGSLGRLPLIVLSHGVPYSYPPAVERRWRGGQRRLAQLSTNSVFLVTRSGQNIPAVLPQVVITAVETMVESLTRSDQAVTHSAVPCSTSGRSRDPAARSGPARQTLPLVPQRALPWS